MKEICTVKTELEDGTRVWDSGTCGSPCIKAGRESAMISICHFYVPKKNKEFCCVDSEECVE